MMSKSRHSIYRVSTACVPELDERPSTSQALALREYFHPIGEHAWDTDDPCGP